MTKIPETEYCAHMRRRSTDGLPRRLVRGEYASSASELWRINYEKATHAHTNTTEVTALFAAALEYWKCECVEANRTMSHTTFRFEQRNARIAHQNSIIRF